MMNKILCEEWLEYFKKINILDRIPDLDELYKEEVFPIREKVFRAFNATTLDNLNVVLIGQDPYPNLYKGEPSACGLCFATENGYTNPSLRVIFKELNRTFYKTNKGNDLVSWAPQGVLMLNASLTVKKGEPNSHAKLWANFTKHLITSLSKTQPDLVWLLMGKNAQEFKKDIVSGYIIEKHHPMVDIYSGKDVFVGSNAFVEVNEVLDKLDKVKINW
jgi:uracil-DNA glycosylase